jgi:subtilisin family serine protease
MSELREYIVTLKNYSDLDSFYEDMETPGGDLHIPERNVECCCRRPHSRNTHYDLTEQEAEQLRNDPRVLAVELTPEEQGLIIRSLFTQTETTWDKTSNINGTHKNWALLRCVEGTQRSNWGSNGTASQSGTIQVNAEGKNVDIVIVDGMINPSHPEYAVNSDGTGGSRLIQYNWFQHDVGNGTGTYVYTPYTGTGAEDDNNHGAHVAGNAAGNTQGWARKANIYNINPYGTDVNGVSGTLLIDYIRAFHAAKPINPETGRRNPTICNHSWGYGYNPVAITSITSVIYQGATINGPFTAGQLNSYGIFTANVSGTVSAIAPARVSAVDADMEDAIADGIIMVGAAGNEFTKVDVPDGVDYNNRFVATFSYFYHQGSTPSAATGCICVGAISSLVNETKGTYSNCGPRVDIYAPGTNIQSSLNINNTTWPGTDDPRNSSFKVGKAVGTSMASPQVTGVLACALEIYPNLTPAKALEYVVAYSKKNQITDTGGSYTDYASLQGSENRYLFYYKERKDTGNTFPKINYQPRTTGGLAFPRVRIRQTI